MAENNAILRVSISVAAIKMDIATPMIESAYVVAVAPESDSARQIVFHSISRNAGI